MLAIIIPYYKLTFFEETLQSLANQTVKRYKVYIGDDASPEDCTLLLKKFESQFDFKYHRFETNLGGISLTQQWERCIDLSNNEEWLMILGDDDVLGPNVVEEFYKEYSVFEEKSNVIRYASVMINEHSEIVSKVYENQTWENVLDYYYQKFEGKTRGSLSEHIFSRLAYNHFGFIDYPLAWHSDDQAWIDFSEGKPLYGINSAKIFIRNSDINISGRSDNLRQKNKATISFYKKIINYYPLKKRLKFIYEYEKLLRKEHKITIAIWFLLFNLYLCNFQVYAFKKFLKRSMIKVFNNG